MPQKQEQESVDWEKVILKTVKKESKKNSSDDTPLVLKVKELRKHVLPLTNPTKKQKRDSKKP
jgi:hypothetical protein